MKQELYNEPKKTKYLKSLKKVLKYNKGRVG